VATLVSDMGFLKECSKSGDIDRYTDMVIDKTIPNFFLEYIVDIEKRMALQRGSPAWKKIRNFLLGKKERKKKIAVYPCPKRATLSAEQKRALILAGKNLVSAIENSSSDSLTGYAVDLAEAMLSSFNLVKSRDLVELAAGYIVEGITRAQKV
jgi:hypothetical protein